MRVLALEPYHGGSHKAFLDGWVDRSRHGWTVLGLPAHHWKWRMRHAAVTLADRAADLVAAGSEFDILFCSEMLPLAEFRGLAPRPLRDVPSVAYFHENQLTYPVRREDERDVHFALTNMTTALAATRCWFNSAFHRDSFLDALGELLAKMPDFRCAGAAERIRERSSIRAPGIEPFGPRGPRRPGPLRILWASRWEHDKDPQTFFQAIRLLRAAGAGFRLSVLGERFRQCPPVFDEAAEEFAERIDRWGYLPRCDDYRAALLDADVIVSTALHEFFGLSVCEAIAAGAYPVLPRRLAYPEILSGEHVSQPNEFFYEGGAPALSDRLAKLARRLEAGDLWRGDPGRAARAVARFSWPAVTEALDDALDDVARSSESGAAS